MVQIAREEEEMKLGITSALIIGMALAFLWHFSNIVRYGSYYIQESNPVILWFEIIFFIGVLLYGLYLFIEVIRREI